MAEVKIEKERFGKFTIIVSPTGRERVNPSTKFKEFREALKRSLGDIAKCFRFDETQGGEYKIFFFYPEDQEDLVDEKFAKLQNRYFRKR